MIFRVTNGAQVAFFWEQVMKELLIFLGGVAIGLYLPDAQAQQYVITNPAGYQTGSVQVQGNQVQVVNNAGYVTQSYTAYPNQLTNQYGAAIGSSSYTVPPVPPSPPSPRVLQ
jgi:LAS superfamily LD-carboxypeptidase LdcB